MSEKRNSPFVRDFLLGGLATSGACVFTNPLEVVKTRLQLQGELGLSKVKFYNGVYHGFVTILKQEGIRGIQKGLTPSIFYQFTMNGVRFGTYSVLKELLGSPSNSDHNAPQPKFAFARNLIAGATAGVCGAVVGSPFSLVKIRFQSRTDFAKHLGHQYNYTSTWDALRSGFRGLMKGADAAALRLASGSSVQLSTYDFSKRLFLKAGLGNETDILVHFSASLLTGLMVVVAMNPFDVVSTRLYNENLFGGKGTLYRGPLDCFWKTLKIEGIGGLYKGALAHYFRVGPHTILTFVFFEHLKKIAKATGLIDT